MKFGKQLADQVNEAWRDHYIDYNGIKKTIKQLVASAAADPNVKPSDTADSFKQTLLQQLSTVNAFFTEQETALALRWKKIDLTVPENLNTEQKKALMHWLEKRLLGNGTKIRRPPQAGPDAEGPNSFVAFCEVYALVQALRQYVAANYVGFIKSMKKFEKQTSVRVAHSFMPRLQRSKFFRSASLAVLLTEVDCAAKDLLCQLGFQGSSTFHEDFQCGVCADIMERPIVLSCTHRFCWQCTASSVAACPDDEWECPTCSRPQTLDPAVLCVSTPLQTFISKHVSSSRKESESAAAEGKDVFAEINRLKMEQSSVAGSALRVPASPVKPPQPPPPGGLLPTAATVPAAAEYGLGGAGPSMHLEPVVGRALLEDNDFESVLETAKEQKFYSDFTDLASMQMQPWPFAPTLGVEGEYMGLEADGLHDGAGGGFMEDYGDELDLEGLPAVMLESPREQEHLEGQHFEGQHMEGQHASDSELSLLPSPNMMPAACPDSPRQLDQVRLGSGAYDVVTAVTTAVQVTAVQEPTVAIASGSRPKAKAAAKRKAPPKQKRPRAKAAPATAKSKAAAKVPAAKAEGTTAKRQKRIEAQRSYRQRMDRATQLQVLTTASSAPINFRSSTRCSAAAALSRQCHQLLRFGPFHRLSSRRCGLSSLPRGSSSTSVSSLPGCPAARCEFHRANV